jgi:hypothetical protein
MTTGAQEVAATSTRRNGWKVAASVLVVVLCALLWLGISLPGGDVFGLAIFDASSWMTIAVFIAGFGFVFGITYGLFQLVSGRGRVWIAVIVTVAVALVGALLGAPIAFRLGASAAAIVEVGQKLALEGDSGGAVRAGLVTVVAAEVKDGDTLVQLSSGTGWSDCSVIVNQQSDGSAEVVAAFCAPD